MNNFLDTFLALPISPIFAFILGTIIGSFLNVVILRKSTTENIGGRSHCTKCDYQLRWYDLIPIVSWLSLKGKCRKCNKKISIQYPIVELITGLVFLSLFNFSLNYTIYSTVGFLMFIWNAIIFSILICIFVYDLYHKIIPNSWSYTFAILALAQTIWLTPVFNGFSNIFTELNLLLDFFAGLIFFIPFFTLWFVSGGRWIGLGDGKLVLGIGWFLGFVNGLSAIILAFWIGAIYAIFIMIFERVISNKNKTGFKSELPFGPFLILGLVIQFFFPIDVIGISYFL